MAKQANTLSSFQPQDDLFAGQSSVLTIDTSFASASRVALDSNSWVDVVPGWMSGSRILFERMISVVPWQEHDRRMFDQTFREPRMTAAYASLTDVPPIGLLEAVRALSDHYGVAYDSLWMNLYRKGEDSTAWHRDYDACRQPECVVPVLTLGATRRFLIKPRHGGRSIAFKPGTGDLIVMGGRSQQDWVHCVPKEPGMTEARISVNFQSSMQATRKGSRQGAQKESKGAQEPSGCAPGSLSRS
jgi:alkylated DNA repair dioxygenase AlkB